MSYSYKYKRGTVLLICLVGGKKYNGQFMSGNPNSINVRNVAEIPDGEKDYLTYEFHKEEIVNLVVLKESNESEPEDEGDPILLLNVQKYKSMKDKAKKNIFVNKMGKRYAIALDHIREMDAIAIITDGCQYGHPTSSIKLLMIATRYFAFIFDLKTVGNIMFENGLKDVFESTSILKIVHNCQDLTDCLKKHHGVNLSHIFDVQLADCLLEQQEKLDVRDNMRTMPILIEQYLKVTEIQQKKLQINLAHIMRRPVSQSLLRLVAMKVALLFDLWTALNEELNNNHCEATECSLFSWCDNTPVPIDYYNKLPTLLQAFNLHS